MTQIKETEAGGGYKAGMSPNRQPASKAPMGGWRAFTAAPHRVMFFAGMLQMLLVMTWWSAELVARANGATLPVTVPAVWAHTLAMLYGVFPFFIFGFLLTVYPRWLSAPALTPRQYLPPFLAFAAGALLFYPGLFAFRALLVAALALMLLGWGLALRLLLGVYLTASKPGRLHERALNLALVLGWLGLLAAVLAVALLQPRLFALARAAGLWLFLVPVVFAVSHRMIPFFSSSVLQNYRMVRPAWSLPLLLACSAGHAVLSLAALDAWLFLVDAPMLAIVLYHTIAWGFFRSFRVRLLAMLHIAFLWLSIALALYTARSLGMLLTGADLLGRAPLHALGIGFIGGLVVAMVSRVTLGHSGRPLVANDLTWLVFLGINATALLRLAAELPLPAGAPLLNAAAAGAWLLGLGVWGAQYLPVYLRPRLDGKPG